MTNNVSRRGFLRLAGAAGLLGLAGCSGNSGSEAKKDDAKASSEGLKSTSGKTLKVLCTNESYKALFDKFTSEVGAPVEYVSMSSGEVLSKLRAEGGTPSADLWFGGGIDAFMPPDKKYFEMERFEQTYETMLRKNPIGLPGSTAGQRQITE